MLTKYEIFLKVVEKGSFTLAAQELGYSQSAVSQTVHGLEEELQTVLIHRGRDGLCLSADGKAYLPYFQSIGKAEKNLAEKRTQMLGLVDETIRIGTVTSVSRNLLPILLQKFHALYPQTHFSLRQGDYDEIHAWIKEGSVDFGFLNPVNFDDLRIEVIYRDSMVAVLSKQNPLAKKKIVTLKDMAEEEFILLDEGKNSVPMKAFADAGLKPHIEYTIYDDYSILAMVRQNMGVSILYRLVVAGFSQGLVLRPIREPIERTIAVAYADSRDMTLASRTFLKFAMQETPKVVKKLGIDQ
ncbi:MAG: LysR family transcriptional regulator [Erysipelotrichaceae bacterium]|jgi:DNA-binding transcriptional LysR family regulator|nr:LysR family transcriptional regulator [Erysipelotrichaceae bacterium]